MSAAAWKGQPLSGISPPNVQHDMVDTLLCLLQNASSGDTVDVFTHCLGVYLGLSDEVMPETIRKWNVKRFVLQRNDRHRDRSIVQDMYQALDLFLSNSSKKSSLKY